MVNQSVTGYFQKLSELLLGLQVADGDGTVLSLDKGTDKAVNSFGIKMSFRYYC